MSRSVIRLRYFVSTILSTYKAITRPILQYASTILSPIVSNTRIQKKSDITKHSSTHRNMLHTRHKHTPLAWRNTNTIPSHPLTTIRITNQTIVTAPHPSTSSSRQHPDSRTNCIQQHQIHQHTPVAHTFIGCYLHIIYRFIYY